MTSSMSGGAGMTPGYQGKAFKEKIPSGYKAGALQQFTPEQIQLFQQLFSHLGPESYLSRLASGDQSMFGEIEAPAFRQFNELQGGLASRFSGMGMGGRHSSGFQNQATSAASNFAQELQSQRQQLQRQALEDLFGMSNQLMGQRPYERFLTQKKKPFWQELLLAGSEKGAEVAGEATSKAALGYLGL